MPVPKPGLELGSAIPIWLIGIATSRLNQLGYPLNYFTSHDVTLGARLDLYFLVDF